MRTLPSSTVTGCSVVRSGLSRSYHTTTTCHTIDSIIRSLFTLVLPRFVWWLTTYTVYLLLPTPDSLPLPAFDSAFLPFLVCVLRMRYTRHHHGLYHLPFVLLPVPVPTILLHTHGILHRTFQFLHVPYRGAPTATAHACLYCRSITPFFTVPVYTASRTGYYRLPVPYHLRWPCISPLPPYLRGFRSVSIHGLVGARGIACRLPPRRSLHRLI